MKNAFTMIELIFIIVIIGILAIIAIPKLSATRNDAKMVTEVNNIANCINDIAGTYTSVGEENNNTEACRSVKCAIIDLGNTKDGNITVTLKTQADGYPKFCDFVKGMAQRKQLDGLHHFSGGKIKLF